MREITYAEAVAEALSESLDEDPRVILIGGGFVGQGPAEALMEEVRRKHGARMRRPPIAELAYCGVGIGAAMVGMRPLIALGTGTFSYEAIPQIVNEAAIACSNSGGQTRVPVTFHMNYGIRGAGGVQHSGTPQPWYWNTPGLQVAMPGSPADVKGLLRWAALRSQNPTVFMSHLGLLDLVGPVPEGPHEIPFGQAAVEREGTDVTIVATGIQVPRALEAAETLAREDDIAAEVVNPRTPQPLDLPTILTSVRKTGRVVVTDESHDHCGIAAGLAALIADEGFPALRAPIKRVSIPPVPIPYAQPLEDYITPLSARIVAAARAVVRGS
jgi:acetoin:2,6-dichlorophenolindophenol oxidoreductase subunit beta